jgi:TRAP transporter TAXI family solute receptor
VNKPRKRASERVAAGILRIIEEGQLEPGAMLPSIDKLAEAFNVGVGTVREALTSLECSGVVEVQHGRGIRVTRPNPSHRFRTAQWRALANGLGVTELLEARMAVETAVARLAAERAGEQQVDELSALVSAMRAAAAARDDEKLLAADKTFHQLMAKAGRNRLLADLVSAIDEQLEFVADRGRFAQVIAGMVGLHEDLASAIGSRQPDKAAELVGQYISHLLDARRVQGLTMYCDVLGSGSAGGSFHIMGQGIVRIIGQHTWLKPQVHITGGGVENVRLAQDRRIVLGITQADTAVDAYYGRGDFEFPHQDLRLLCCLHSLELQLSTLEGSGIESLQDLRGRVVAMGSQGGATSRVARALLRHVGLEPDVDFQTRMYPFSTAVEMLRRRKVDAVAFLSIGQSPALLELALEEPIRLLGVPEDAAKVLMERHPYWHLGTVEAGTYPGQGAPVPSIGVPTVLVTHKDLPDSDAYAIVSAIVDHIDELQSVVYPSRFLSIHHAAASIGIPFHPGAAARFSELLSDSANV